MSETPLATSMMTPYVAIGADELGEPMAIGDWIECDLCGGRHPVSGGTDAGGNETAMVLAYKCGEDVYVAGIDGHSLMDRFRAVRAQNEEAGASAEEVYPEVYYA